MAQAQFPEPKSLNILEIGDGMDHSKQKYNLDNPAPGYGVDPNIINHYGHTVYPKMVYPSGKDGPYVIAKDAKHEAELMGTAEQAQEPAKEQAKEPVKANEPPTISGGGW